MRLRNLTPHPVTLVLVSGETVTLPPEGTAPRVEDTGRQTWDCIAHVDGGWEWVTADPVDEDDRVLDSVPLYEVRPGDGDVVGLPDEEPDTYLIVSRLVAEAATDRGDLLYPYDLVRDEQGRVVGAQGLARANHEPPAEEWLPRARALIAELTAIDAGLPHDPDAEWPEALRRRRDYLIRRLWIGARVAHADGWDAWRSTDPSDPQRPDIAVIILPTGLQLRYHVSDPYWLPRRPTGLDRPDVPYDGLSREQRREAIARWLAETAPGDPMEEAMQRLRTAS